MQAASQQSAVTIVVQNYSVILNEREGVNVILSLLTR